MMNRILFFAVTSFLITMTACSTKTLMIASETRFAMGVGPRECYMVKQTADEDWQFMYDRIQGFDYEKGYEYVIKMKEKEVKNPPADASSKQYTLTKVVSKTKKNSVGLPPEKLFPKRVSEE